MEGQSPTTKLLVLTDKSGNIRGAFVPMLPTGEDRAVRLVPAEDEVVHEITLPDEEFGRPSLADYQVSGGGAEARLVRRDSEETT
jgi:hypothetical protein